MAENTVPAAEICNVLGDLHLEAQDALANVASLCKAVEALTGLPDSPKSERIAAILEEVRFFVESLANNIDLELERAERKHLKPAEPLAPALLGSNVHALAAYRQRDTVAVLRDLLERAEAGSVRGLVFCFKSGPQMHRVGSTGCYRDDPETALIASGRIAFLANQYIGSVRDEPVTDWCGL